MAVPANCARAYTVVSGDSCNAISFKESVSSFQLALVNSAIIDPACDNLFPGEAICLGLTGQDCNTIRVVESGDTCLAIAAWAGIPFSTLLANNKNVDNSCSNLIPGEVRDSHNIYLTPANTTFPGPLRCPQCDPLLDVSSSMARADHERP
ncbi:hypothetical protein BC629DRAFT_1282313 [Irpex lacteus]|nr:hypothetical protein BC629DRAFT_1282313 [Irpex lacteus]